MATPEQREELASIIDDAIWSLWKQGPGLYSETQVRAKAMEVGLAFAGIHLGISEQDVLYEVNGRVQRAIYEINGPL